MASVADMARLAFMFAHCGDPKGDRVDAEADAARQLNLPPTTPWHIDEARPHLQKLARTSAGPVKAPPVSLFMRHT